MSDRFVCVCCVCVYPCVLNIRSVCICVFLKKCVCISGRLTQMAALELVHRVQDLLQVGLSRGAGASTWTYRLMQAHHLSPLHI